jgi:hypothetical protein
MLITILERPIPRIGLYHRPTNHWVASWNRPRTDVVGPYCIAAARCIHLALYTMNSIDSVRIVVGSVLNSLGSYSDFYRFVSQIYRVVLWFLSVRIANLLGRTLISFGSYRKSTGSYSDFFRFMPWISSARTDKNRDTNRTWYEPIIGASAVHNRVVSPQTDTYLWNWL